MEPQFPGGELYKYQENERRRRMSQIELSYEDLKQEMIKEIEKRQLKILATSEGDFVTAREVRFISDGLTMFCFTDHRSRKYEQIKANPNVAIAVGNLSIEGVASLKGRPLNEENAKYLETFREKQPDWCEHWSQAGHFQNPNMRVIDVTPKRIAMYKTRAFDKVPESYLAILNVVKEEAYRLKPSDFPEAPAYRE